MKKIALVLASTCLLLLATTSYSQTQFSGWLATFNTYKTGKKTSIHNDIQLRSSDDIKHMQTFLFRAGLNVQVRKNMIATAGYAYISNRRVITNVSGSVSGYAPEHRIWEQFIISHKIKTVATSHRFRLEQRFISKSKVVNNELENDGHVYANRFRYFIRNVLPLKKQESFKKGMFIGLQNEVFVNIGNTANVNGQFFDQNRLFVSTGYRINPKMDVEMGYLNQYVEGRISNTHNHVLQLGTYLRL